MFCSNETDDIDINDDGQAEVEKLVIDTENRFCHHKCENIFILFSSIGLLLSSVVSAAISVSSRFTALGTSRVSTQDGVLKLEGWKVSTGEHLNQF